MVVFGVVQDDVNDTLVFVARFQLLEQRYCAVPVNGFDLYKRHIEIFKTDRTMDIYSFTPGIG